MIEDILKYNQEFVNEGKYKPFETSKYPDKKLAIVTCMDTRLTELLPAALGIKNGDAKIIKNAGGVIIHPFGSAVRSLLIAIYELGVNEVMIIGHTDCGVQSINSQAMVKKMLNRGIDEKDLRTMEFCGIDFEKWLAGFSDVESSVQNSVDILNNHPLIPHDIKIYGYIMDSVTGQLRRI